MLVSLQAPAPFKDKEYTNEEIDNHLSYIAQIMRLGTSSDRKQALRRANQWLDKRNGVTNLERELANV